jgi:hypothetical protein
MTKQEIKEIIRQELPDLFYKDVDIHRFILELSTHQFADKVETENKFERLLEEIHQLRDEGNRIWEEQRQKWEEQAQKWEEQNQKWEENNRQIWKMMEEQNKKWEENNKQIRRLMERNEELSKKHDSTIGALGARWGLYTEHSFRNALKGILEDSFDVEVLNVTEYDDNGEVFGHPDQIELDIIIKNGTLIICEIKSSMSKSDVYSFDRKVRFYEKHHQRKASECIIISPMVDKKAQEVADRLGIKVYSYAEDVELEEL